MWYVHHQTNTWLEITTLLIPGQNDSEKGVSALAAWVGKELGSDAPLHFTALHPDWRMCEMPATPPETLGTARRIARDHGLRHVYTGNVFDTKGQSTVCRSRARTVIGRDGYRITSCGLGQGGLCTRCGTAIPCVLEAGRAIGASDYGPYKFPNRRFLPEYISPSVRWRAKLAALPCEGRFTS